jgi:3-oxoacyl-(acyl-carrier-protein) synthase
MGDIVDRSDPDGRLLPGPAWRTSDVRRHDHPGLVLSGGAAAAVLGPEALAIARAVIYAALFDYPLTSRSREV